MMHLSDTKAADRDIMAEIGGRLRDVRKQQGHTIVAAAEIAGLDRTTVSRAEQGANPTLLTLVRLLRVYGRLDALEVFAADQDTSPAGRPESGDGGSVGGEPEDAAHGFRGLVLATRVRVRPGEVADLPGGGRGRR